MSRISRQKKRDVPNELHALQGLVGGRIETVRISCNVLALVNEEGIIRGLPYNGCLVGAYNTPRIFGPVMFVGVNDEEFTDLPEYFDEDDAEALLICRREWQDETHSI